MLLQKNQLNIFLSESIELPLQAQMTTNKKNKHIVVPQLGDYRALTTLGVPLVIGQIGVVLQNFADTLMIGHHTTVELAAASLVSNIFILGLLMAMGFALCLTPVIGRSFGQDDTKSIGKTTRNGMAVNTLAALFLMGNRAALFLLQERIDVVPDRVFVHDFSL